MIIIEQLFFIILFGKLCASSHLDTDECVLVPPNDRLDCFPTNNANQKDCEARGCCWIEVVSPKNPPNVPYCFYRPKTPTYTFIKTEKIPNGLQAVYKINRTSPYPRDVTDIKVVATFQSDAILNVKILDVNNERFESPFPEVQLPEPSTQNPLYGFSVGKEGFEIIRKSDNTSIFSTSNFTNFIFSDQLLQITTKLPSKNIYGLGEKRGSLKLSTDWSQITLFNRDASPANNINIYGTHPFYVCLEESAKANGVFLKNSHGLELILQPTPALTYRAIGGIFDFYIFLGPTPADVVSQYQVVVGKPKMPPYWGLGFHLCRYGIKTLAATQAVLQRNLAVGIPVEVQWNDLDYMEKNNDFTYNKETFVGLPNFIKNLHQEGRRYAILIDPGVSGAEPEGTYLPYSRGVDLKVFVKENTGEIFYGKVWNLVSTVFPDFTHPNASTYWKEMLNTFRSIVPFDGAWIDMNEPSNNIQMHGCPNNQLENPPYLPNVLGGSLKDKTVCMSAKQYAGVHYHLHNLYGISEMNITSRVLSEILGERSFVISRSTFAGSGRYGGHWGGDVYSSWDDLRHSIPHLLDFSLFGIPLMGSDICGFNDDTTVDLCNRWMQLGAFYPFSRNHNSIDRKDQDPAILGEQVIRSSVKALNIRYSLLPYLYTLFWQAAVNGTTVARPLFLEFPDDPRTYTIDTTFLWGAGLLIAPVLENDPAFISVYFPKGIWYDYYTRDPINSEGENVNIKTDKDTIPLFIRGGHVLVTQSAASLTEEVRKSELRVLAALDEKGEATGLFYWDDGISSDVGSDYAFIQYKVFNRSFHSEILHMGNVSPPKLFSIEIIGINEVVDNIIVNKKNHDTFNQKKNLVIEDLHIDLSPVRIQWT